jgi:hypothetical protein
VATAIRASGTVHVSLHFAGQDLERRAGVMVCAEVTAKGEVRLRLRGSEPKDFSQVGNHAQEYSRAAGDPRTFPLLVGQHVPASRPPADGTVKPEPSRAKQRSRATHIRPRRHGRLGMERHSSHAPQSGCENRRLFSTASVDRRNLLTFPLWEHF